MSVLIYGTRDYGRVDEHANEYAHTRFFHLWFLPIFPTGSTWITGEAATGPLGHQIKLYGKSVAACYLRVWGPVIALLTAVGGLQGHLPVLVVAAAMIAGTVWSWTWLRVRGRAAVRRSDFNYVAFGMRCEPKRLPKELRAELKAHLDRRWDAAKPERSPNEIAKHGAANADEAALAYGLLRLAAVERDKAASTANAEADRILAGDHVAIEHGDGPFRAAESSKTGATTDEALAELVARRTAEQAASRAAAGFRPPSPEELAKRAKRRGRRQMAGLVALTLFSLGGVAMFVRAVQPTKDVTLKELRSVKPPINKKVRVECDAIDGPVITVKTSSGTPRKHIMVCVLGQYWLPVMIDAEDAMPTKVVSGRLHLQSDVDPWVKKLREEPDLDSRALDMYLEDDVFGEWISAAMGLAVVVATPICWVLWFRARRRRKRALAGSVA